MRAGIGLAGIVAVLSLGGCATMPDAQPAAGQAGPGRQYQWLLGSAEAAILSFQTHAAMADFAKGARSGVVLAPGATLAAPRFVPCGAKPRAVIYDIDETVLLNTGANYDAARRGDPPFDPARWARYEREGARLVEPVPGVVEAIRDIRAAGITVVFNSNRDKAYAAQAADALASVGIAGAVPGETLFLKGDVAPGSAKDPRREAVAGRFCVVAMAGDNLGDFADAFNAPGLGVQARRRLATEPGIRRLWGAGWFVLPNPLYGAGVAGGYDDLFPADRRWNPDATQPIDQGRSN